MKRHNEDDGDDDSVEEIEDDDDDDDDKGGAHKSKEEEAAAAFFQPRTKKTNSSSSNAWLKQGAFSRLFCDEHTATKTGSRRGRGRARRAAAAALPSSGPVEATDLVQMLVHGTGARTTEARPPPPQTVTIDQAFAAAAATTTAATAAAIPQPDAIDVPDGDLEELLQGICTQHQEQGKTTATTNMKQHRNVINVDSDFEDDGEEEGTEQQSAEQSEAERALRQHAEEPLVLGGVQLERSFTRQLFDFQREGIAFLYGLYEQGSGGILADDMGLGKTVQAIGFIAAVLGDALRQGTLLSYYHSEASQAVPPETAPATAPQAQVQATREVTTLEEGEDQEEKKPKPVLVVVPAGVVRQWVDEFARWLHTAAGVYHGASRGAVLARVRAGALRVVVTSYETFRLDLGVLGAVRWACVVFDEVHRLKGSEALNARCAAVLRGAPRYGLTGTLMQNSFDELWTLVSLVRPRFLGTRAEFHARFVAPIRTGQQHGAPLAQVLAGRRAGKVLARRLRRVVLRREKRLLGALLPAKADTVVFCRLSALQTAAYARLVASPVYRALFAMTRPCRCRSGRSVAECPCPFGRDTLAAAGAAGISLHRELFPAIVRLQKLANHLLLISPDSSNNTSSTSSGGSTSMNSSSNIDSRREETLEREKEFCALAYGPDAEKIAAVCRADGDQAQLCGKIAVLRRIVRRAARARRKVLLFAHMTRTLDLLAHFLAREGVAHARMDGSVPAAARAAHVERFARGASTVFLLSTRVASLGFNIPAATVVVLFEPDWNPAQDLQAQDRAYRIGQTRATHVYRLVSAHTVEELIYERQVYKHQMAAIALDGRCARRYFDGVAGVRGREGELWGLGNILRFSPAPTLRTSALLRRAQAAEARLGFYTADQQRFLQAAGSPTPAAAPIVPVAKPETSEPLPDAQHNQDASMIEQLLRPDNEGDDDGSDDDGDDSSNKPEQASNVLYAVRHTDVVVESRVEKAIGDRVDIGSADIDIDDDDVDAQLASPPAALEPITLCSSSGSSGEVVEVSPPSQPVSSSMAPQDPEAERAQRLAEALCLPLDLPPRPAVDNIEHALAVFESHLASTK